MLVPSAFYLLPTAYFSKPMRWFPYFILAYVVLGIQIGLGDFLSWQGARPNLVLAAVLFVALNAPRDAALLGCFSLGLFQDLLSQQPPGLYALSYGLVGMLGVAAQQSFNRDHPVLHGILALAAGLVVASVLAVHAIVRPPPAGVVNGAVVPAARVPILPLFITAVYTALLAPALLWLLHRFKRRFAFQSSSARRGWR